MKIISPGLDFYVDRLRRGRCFSFVRIGNGEWDCIFKSRMRTGSGSQLLKVPGLRPGLMEGIRAHQGDDSYFLAMQSRSYLTRCNLLNPAEQWLRRNAPKAKWYDGEVLHTASRRGELYPLIAQFHQMNLIVVGPARLEGLKKVFPRMKFVSVRSKNCFADYLNIRNRILEMLETYSSGVVVSFSAGPAAKVLIHQLHNQGHFLIDFGSLWDPYVGKNTRKYHKYVTAAVQKRNLNV